MRTARRRTEQVAYWRLTPKAMHYRILYYLEENPMVRARRMKRNRKVLACCPIILPMVCEMVLVWTLTPSQVIYGTQKTGRTSLTRLTVYCRDLIAAGQRYTDRLGHQRMK